MSLSGNKSLFEVAKLHCRELRKNQTNAEKMFWEVVRNRKVLGCKFNRQYPIFHDLKGQETFYIADFYCHEKKLIIEIDGPIHEFQIESDKERTNILEWLGFEVVRFKNQDVEECIDNVITRLEKFLTRE